jgi:transposase
MSPLPATRYEVVDWKRATVNIDYHIVYDNRFYSVPFAYIRQQVEIRATSSVIEVLHQGERIASHQRCYGPKGTATVVEQHRPRSHQQYGKWPPERVQEWASNLGQHVGMVAKAIVARYQHPEAGYRPCLGLIRLAERFGQQRLDDACKRALEIQSPSYKTVKGILSHGLEKIGPQLREQQSDSPIEHSNLRGPEYYN